MGLGSNIIGIILAFIFQNTLIVESNEFSLPTSIDTLCSVVELSGAPLVHNTSNAVVGIDIIHSAKRHRLCCSPCVHVKGMSLSTQECLLVGLAGVQSPPPPLSPSFVACFTCSIIFMF